MAVCEKRARRGRFLPYWDLFEEMLFWDKKNRYIEGMDPIFLYSYSPSLFWKLEHLRSQRTAAWTTGSPDPESGVREPTIEVLRRDFGASYSLVVKPLHPRMFDYMRSEPSFYLGSEDEVVAIFRLTGDNAPDSSTGPR